MGWFNPSDVGNSSKEGSSFTTAATLKQTLTQAPSLRLPDPEKAFQLYVHEREGIALGVLTQRLGSETQPVVYLPKRLDPTAQGWPPCLLKSCHYCNLERRCFKTLFGGKTNYFCQPPSETTPKWERPFMDVWPKNPQISSSADGKPRPHYTPLVRFLTQQPSCLTPRALSLLTLA